MKIRNYLFFSLLFLIILILPTCISNSSFKHTSISELTTETVLVTGFGPFDIYDINPSELIIEEINGQYIEGIEIIGIVLPVDFSESVKNVTKAIDEYDPLLLVSTGLSPKAKKLNVEKIGVNIKMYPKGEKFWFLPRRLEIFGPLFRLSTLNIKEIVSNLNDEGIPSRQSYYAGFYICNAVLYGSLGYIRENNLSTKVGFIHVPLLSSQDPNGMDLETMVEGLKIAIKTSLN